MAVAWLTLTGCAAAHEPGLRADLHRAQRDLLLEVDAADKPSTPPYSASLNEYLAFALKHSPEIRAEFERWRAAVFSISRARRLPEPMIGYGFYIQSVETRVGPQRHRIGLSQTFPWPTKLTAGADAASAKARAAQRRFDAKVLATKKKVADAYWNLWLIEEQHRLKSEHDVVLETLAGTVREEWKRERRPWPISIRSSWASPVITTITVPTRRRERRRPLRS